MDNKYYWVEKDERAKIAQAHTEHMKKRFGNEIRYSVASSHIYGPGAVKNVPAATDNPTEVILSACGSVEGIVQNYKDGEKIAVLNFASYRNPGGMFLNGSRAQEECLCHESFLYNVLAQFPDYYRWNEDHKNRALYTDRAIYSPQVLFMHDNHTFPTDVITCAAPNLSWAIRYNNEDAKRDNHGILRNRIKFVLDIAAAQGVDTLVLGAFGCGVFKQDATEVANDFMDFLQTTHKGIFKKVVFAIPQDVHGGNYDKFKDVLEKRGK
jgi:uncharacterized protein (TIGR02452 family)